MRIEVRSHWLILWSLALFLPLVMKYYLPASGGLDVTGHQIGRDFINVWVGPQLAFNDRIGTLFDLRGYHAAISELFGAELPFHGWGYPLFTLILFWPLALLPYFVALAIWTVLGFAAFAAVILSQIDKERRGAALLVLALAPACLINTVGGQNGFLTASLFIGGVLAIDRRPILAGVLFGVLTLKPQLGIVIPFALLALGAWRTIAVATVTALLLFAISLAVFGIEPARQYFTITSAVHVSLLHIFEGYYTYMMVSLFAGARTFGASYASAMALQVAVGLPVLIASVWAVRRTQDPRLRALVLVAAAPLLTPYTFNYDLTAVAGTMVWAIFGAVAGPRPTLAFVLVWLVPTLTIVLGVEGIGLMPFVLILQFIAAIECVRGADRQQVPAQAY